jgi:hypothetical protein
MSTWSIKHWFRAAAIVSTAIVSSLVGASSAIAPTFSLPSRSGDNVSLESLKGQVVMLNF